MDTEPESELATVDQAVRRAVREVQAWHEALRREPFQSSVAKAAPLARHRRVAGQRAFDALTSRHEVAPRGAFRAALRRWVGALAVRRVTEAQQAAVARVEGEPSVRVELETVEETTFRRGWKRLLQSRSLAEASAWLHALAERGAAIAQVRRDLAARSRRPSSGLGPRCGRTS